MVFIPDFGLDVLNGWLFFAIYLVVLGIAMLKFSPAVRARLYDRSLWTKKRRILMVVGKLFSLVNIILIIVSPLRMDTPFFITGLVLWGFGLIGLVTALINYNDTPLDTPVTKGIYQYSRNPQIFSIWVIFVGIYLMIGSGLSLLVMAVSLIFLHNATLAEEEACLQQYGEPYRAFMDSVPRYFLFF